MRYEMLIFADAFAIDTSLHDIFAMRAIAATFRRCRFSLRCCHYALILRHAAMPLAYAAYATYYAMPYYADDAATYLPP